MFDGFWSGIFGGLFGPTIALWLSRFKYWVTFLLAMMSMHMGLFVALIYSNGLRFAIDSMLKNTFTLVGIFVPVCGGLFAVLLAFLGSINIPKKQIDDDTQK